MGAQWKQAGREANANKRGIIVGKIAKEIQVAVKLGGPNPEGNHRLKAALEAAKKASVTRDTIERAIKKGSGVGSDAVIYELITYEGFAPHKVPVIVECLTDNKNRTASEVRTLFRKGQLGSIGSVGWMFDRMGVVEATHKDGSIDIESVAIEAGAQNVEALDKSELKSSDGDSTPAIGARFISDASDLGSMTKFLIDSGWAVSQSELCYIAKNSTELSAEQRKEVESFLTDIDDFDDVHRVYAAL